jgi:hypothetical protein
VFGLVASVECFVVGGAGLPHFPEDLEPTLAEASQGYVVFFPIGVGSFLAGGLTRFGYSVEEEDWPGLMDSVPVRL